MYVQNSVYYTGNAYAVCGAVVNGDNYSLDWDAVKCPECLNARKRSEDR